MSGTSLTTAPNVKARPRAASTGLIMFLRFVQVLLTLAFVFLLLSGLALMTGALDSIIANSETLENVPSNGRLGFASLTGALIAAAWYYVLGQLIRVVRTVQDGDPFIDANVGRLRRMWVVIAAAEVFRLVIHAFANISADTVSQAETGLDLRLSTIFLVLVIASLSEAFRLGVELRRDAELTI